MGFAMPFPRYGFYFNYSRLCRVMMENRMNAPFIFLGLSIYWTPKQGQFLSTRFLLIRLYSCFPVDWANLEMQQPSLSQKKTLREVDPICLESRLFQSMITTFLGKSLEPYCNQPFPRQLERCFLFPLGGLCRIVELFPAVWNWQVTGSCSWFLPTWHSLKMCN